MRHARLAAVVAAATAAKFEEAGVLPGLPGSRNALKPKGFEARDEEAPGIVEVRKSIGDLMKLVTDERAAFDEKFKQLEARAGTVDPLTAEKLVKIDEAMGEVRKQLDALEARAKRAGAAKEAEDIPGADPEYRKAFNQFMRRGDQGCTPEALAMLQKRAMSVSDNTDGGYLTNVELDRELAKLARNVSPARQIFAVRQIGSNAYKKPISKSNSGSGWVGELDGRPQTSTTDLGEISIPTHEIYAMPGASQSILDDAFINLEEFIAQEATDAFDDQESTAFFTGNGVNKPMGLLAIAVTVETATGATRAAQGKLGVLKTGADTDFGTGTGAGYYDNFIALISRLRSKYRQNARWLYNALTEGKIRQVKDTTGNYMWQPSNQLGVPATFLGYSATVCDHMPDIGAGNIPVAFGDFQRAYQIIDRVGVRTLRDPFTAKPYVLFYMTKRVGGGHLVTEAFKGLQTAT